VVAREHTRDGASAGRSVFSVFVPSSWGRSWPFGFVRSVEAGDAHERHGSVMDEWRKSACSV
jgi:hypothetical protein